MSVRMRATRAHTRNRRSHHFRKLYKPTLVHCKKCGSKKLFHAVCLKCGYYRGKRILGLGSK